MAAKHNPNIHGKSSHELQFFNFESIALATNNFAPLNKLGEGGFGPVYMVYVMLIKPFIHFVSI